MTAIPIRCSTRRHLPLLPLLASGLLLLGGRPASAVSVTPDPLPFSVFQVAGSIDFVGESAGLPSGGAVLAGAVTPTDTSLLFTLSLDPGSDPIDNLSLINFSDAAVAIGTVAGAGVDVESGTLNFPDVAFAGSGVGPGQTSDAIFVSYASVTDGAEISFELFGALVILGQVTIVPEPSTATLLAAAGLACCLLGRRFSTG